MTPLRAWGEAEEADYQERAAILEYEAGLPRAEAEHTARWMVARSSGAVPPARDVHDYFGKPTAKPPAAPARSPR